MICWGSAVEVEGRVGLMISETGIGVFGGVWMDLMDLLSKVG